MVIKFILKRDTKSHKNSVFHKIRLHRPKKKDLRPYEKVLPPPVVGLDVGAGCDIDPDRGAAGDNGGVYQGDDVLTAAALRQANGHSRVERKDVVLYHRVYVVHAVVALDLVPFYF